ncbi:DNA-binding response regulator [Putridiphycobacter roseus]|uniref:DNA-binding response regulator n=1 Tax=Putridiphycobacter roseus TaxID=2219161 RepID=A0A2W1MZ31_9FLAO|nr:response regulator transcription factor [Putridiphycobacter roseus]PZE16500.1 DNA-binding response regulator [Putridiphycobacter roseus]
MIGQKILIVDDEPDIVDLLAYNFKKQEMAVFSANNGKEAIEIAKKQHPEVILLDVMLPDIDGMEVCEELRKDRNLKNSLILFLSARGEDYSQIAGYKVGADDYIVKPVKLKVLTEKIRTLLERRNEEPLGNITSTNISIDANRYTVSKDGAESIIPKKEFELLTLLMSKPEKVYRREEILEQIWGVKTFVGDRTIDVHIRKLREKFGQTIIKTVKGIGYKFEDNP